MTSTPAVVDGVVYFGDWAGNVVALKASDGVWKKATGKGLLSGSPNVTADAVYIGGDGGWVHALKRSDGSILWQVQAEKTPNARIWSSPVIVDNTLIIGNGSYQVFYPATPAFRGNIVGLDISQNGKELWRAYVCDSGKAGVSVWSSAAIDKDLKLAFIGTGQGYTKPAAAQSDSLAAIDYTTGAIKWSKQFTAADAFQNNSNGTPINDGPDYDVGASPNLFEAGGKKLVGVGDKAGHYYALSAPAATWCGVKR